MQSTEELFERFADMDEVDGYDFDSDSSDRVVFFVILTRLETGDLDVKGAFGELADRYPDEIGFRIAACDAVADGPWADAEAFASFLSTLSSGNVAFAEALAVVQADGGEDSYIDLVETRKVSLSLDDAYQRLDGLRLALVAEGEERTRDGNTWAERITLTPSYPQAKAAFAGGAKPYSPKASFGVGDWLEHPRFGLGHVIRLSPSRAVVRFESGDRTLVCR